MGLCGAISYIIGNIVGAGLFITPTSVLQQVDSVGLSLIIWSVAALISLLGAFCYVELGTSIRRSGADFAYLCYVKWYPIAFAFMCVGCFVIFPATLAIQAETFRLLMMLNFFSLKIFVSRFQIVASFAKIITTAIVICTGFYFIIFKGETQNLQNIMDGTQVRPGHIIAALFAGLFSYDGWDVLNFGTEEIEKPKRTMPLAIIVGMSLVAFIFLATNISFFAMLDIDQMKSSVAVADTFAAAKLDKFYSVIPFLICILLIGSMNTSLFCASRYLYVAARQGHLPTFLSCSNTEHNSPRVAIFISVTLSFLLSFTGNLSQLINCVSFCQWLQRIFTMLALLWIRFHHKSIHRDAIQNPIIMPIIFMIICATLVTTTVITDTHICSIGGSVALGGLVFYFLFFYTHLPSAVEGFKTFGCNANNKITIYTQIVFNVMPPEFSEEITRTCQVNLSPTPEASGNTDSITNSEGGNNAVQVF